MKKTSSRAEQSAWFRQYEASVNSKKQASDSKKWILIIIPLLLIGCGIGIMIKNGALDNEQSKNGVYALAGIGGFLLLMIIILLAKSKKKDAAAITREDLDELLQTPQDAAAFDAQMQENAKLLVVNKKDEYFFATRDYLATKFNFLGNLTYRFIRSADVEVLHIVTRDKGSCDVEFRAAGGKVLMIWVASDKSKVEELKAGLANIGVRLNFF